MNHATIRKEITERLTKNWDYSEQQLADLSIFHLVNILIRVSPRRPQAVQQWRLSRGEGSSLYRLRPEVWRARGCNRLPQRFQDSANHEGTMKLVA
jgi:hypothetical protein